MKHARAGLLVVASLLAIACGSSDDAGQTTPTGGTVTLKFAVSNGVRQSPNLADPLSGTVHGSIFKSEDVALTGPIDGAVGQDSVLVSGVDLTTADESEASFNGSNVLEPGQYTFLGFFDVDGNGDVDESPDPGDPVTLPNANQFTIETEQNVSLTATFDLVLN